MIDQFIEPIRLYFLPTLGFIFSVWYIWIPLLLLFGFIHLWINFKRREFHFNQGFAVLEIKLPRDITKSPLAMETALAGFYLTSGETTFIDRYINGKTRPWFSLELVSQEGQVKFFIWTRRGLKQRVETLLYAQYPLIEIYEVADYTTPFKSDPHENTVWGCEFDLTKPDPYPIKTYTDYGLDKNPDEEFKIDPLASLIEFLGSFGKGEHVWFQIIMRAHKKEKHKVGTWFGKTDWTEDAEREIKKLRSQLFVTTDDGATRQLAQTEGLKNTIAALERSISKLAFDVGIRALYIAEKDRFNPTNISGITNAFKAFGSQDLNGFKPARGLTDFDYPWQDYGDWRKNKTKQSLIDAYKRRSYFYPPAKKPSFVLNTEEIATLYHFPGPVVATPTLARIPSRKAEAPNNLPI